MAKNFTLLLAIVFLGCYCSAQVTLFSENFNSGTSGGFTLNTSDVSSTPAGYNYWIVNNAYTGGSGSIVCLGFPFSYTIASTPGQPAGITGAPSSHYLHTMSTAGAADMIYCSSFAAADGLCYLDQNCFVRMTSDISTVGYTGTKASYWWTCGGGSNIWGELYYSTNSGTSWTLVTIPTAIYKNQFSWKKDSVSLAAFDGQATLRFGWRFYNVTSSAATDPGMSIDDFVISAVSGSPSITSVSVTPLSYCEGKPATVNFTVGTAFSGGNIFTAQLSDATGSFAAPTNIGTLAGTTSGAISATIPLPTAGGTGYRIRVISSVPATIGPDNGSNITIYKVPVLNPPIAADDSLCTGESTMLTSSTTAGTIGWVKSTDGGTTFSNAGLSGTPVSTGPLTTNTIFKAYSVNGVCDTVFSNIALVNVSSGPIANFSSSNMGLTVNFTNLSTGSPILYKWYYGDGDSSTLANPSHNYPTGGSYTVTLIVWDAFGCSDTTTNTTGVLVSISVPDRAFEWSVSPNPSSDYFVVSGRCETNSELFVTVYSITGSIVAEQKVEYHQGGSFYTKLNIDEGWPDGIYFVKLSNGYLSSTTKVVVQN